MKFPNSERVEDIIQFLCDKWDEWPPEARKDKLISWAAAWAACAHTEAQNGQWWRKKYWAKRGWIVRIGRRLRLVWKRLAGIRRWNTYVPPWRGEKGISNAD